MSEEDELRGYRIGLRVAVDAVAEMATKFYAEAQRHDSDDAWVAARTCNKAAEVIRKMIPKVRQNESTDA